MSDETLSTCEKVKVLFDLYETGVAMMRQNIRRQNPETTEIEIEQKMTEWLLDRPGPEFGDGVGRPNPQRFAHLKASFKPAKRVSE